MKTKYAIAAAVVGAFAAVGVLQHVNDAQTMAAASKATVETVLSAVVSDAHACPPANGGGGGGGGRQGNNGYGNGGGDGVPGRSNKQDRTR